MTIVAVILAGGQALRMGGGDKPLRLLAGRPMLDHVLAALRGQVAHIAINANGDPARFASWGLPVLPDPLPDHPGPLAGILAGLDWAATQGADWLVSAPGDCPFVPADYVARLRQAAAPLACAESAGQAHPPCGLWPVGLRQDLREAMRAGERKVARWTARHGVARVSWSTTPVDPFFNANTPAELAQAEIMLRRLREPSA